MQYAGRVSNMNLVYGLVLLEFSVAQVDRVPARYLWGHRFESCRGRLRFFLPHASDMLIISFSHKLEVVVTEILWKLEIRFKTDLRKIYENPDRGRPHFSLLRRGLFCVVASEAGEKERDSARGTMGRRKREERLRVRTSAFYFSIIAMFIGKPSGSLWGGESSHFGWLDVIGFNICNKNTCGS